MSFKFNEEQLAEINRLAAGEGAAPWPMTWRRVHGKALPSQPESIGCDAR
ncbi:MAG: hypothetical protein U5K75_09590 [Ahrensia sp.]|nr:hypothetical protein [Ahrensia sp.]